MERPKLIWFDMTITTRHAEIDQNFLDYFDVHYNLNARHPENELELEPGVAICFEFDYPDRPGLSLLCRTKESYPRIPILMLTAQHSEQLAVWAYRNRVLDYLVRPVAVEDLRRCKDLLQAIQVAEQQHDSRSSIDYKYYKSNIPVDIPAGQRLGSVRLAPAVNFVQKNFRRKMSNAEVAELCGMSSFHFSHAFTGTFSLTFQEFVLRYRIFEACRELQHPNVPVANVAYSVGFNDPSYFARVFKRFVGISPSEYCEKVESNEIDRQMRDLVERLGLPQLDSMKSDHRHNKYRHTYFDCRGEKGRVNQLASESKQNVRNG